MDMLVNKKKNTGRKKIEIKKLVKNSNKQVTFSKRRVGMFKKASELCVLCNVQIAIIVFSPGDKLFCFGHPNAGTVINRYVKGTAESEAASKSRARLSTTLYREYNLQFDEATKMLEMEKEELAEVETLAKVWNRGEWWNESIDDMSVDQIEQYMLALYELRGNLVERADKLALGKSMMFALW